MYGSLYLCLLCIFLKHDWQIRLTSESLLLNNIQDMYITSSFKFMEKYLNCCQTCSLIKCFKNGWTPIYKLCISDQNTMYVTKRINKWNKCIIQEIKWWIFWVMLILQNCAMSLSFYWIESKIVKEDITFPLLSSSRAIKWLKIA